MKQSWLIQRLQQPRTGRMGAIVSAFSFGGGLKNGGLSDNAMSLLQEVFSFDYMGAAEFEWGAVPEALTKIAQNTDKYQTCILTLDEVDERAIYVIGAKKDMKEIEDRIKVWATEPYNRNLKESTRLSSTLNPKNEWDGKTQGWLELDNGFFFFTDKEMFTKTATLFGLDY